MAAAPVEPGDESPFAAERAIVASARPVRRAEFFTGRALARRALAELGVAPRPILRSERGAPRWPAGTIGSIAHSAGWCAVVVAPGGSARGLGLDLEALDAPIDDAMRRRIATAAELEAAAGAAGGLDPAVLLFSAKEAVFKAVHPIDGTWLEHHDLWVTLAGSSFATQSRVPLPTGVTGRFALAGPMVVAGVVAGVVAA